MESCRRKNLVIQKFKCYVVTIWMFYLPFSFFNSLINVLFSLLSFLSIFSANIYLFFCFFISYIIITILLSSYHLDFILLFLYLHFQRFSILSRFLLFLFLLAFIFILSNAPKICSFILYYLSFSLFLSLIHSFILVSMCFISSFVVYIMSFLINNFILSIRGQASILLSFSIYLYG